MSMNSRKTELSIIESFLCGFSDEGEEISPILYISGSPGTGKTALTNCVLSSTTFADDVKPIFVNCMSLSGPDALWNRIGEEFMGSTGKRTSKVPHNKENIAKFLAKEDGIKRFVFLMF